MWGFGWVVLVVMLLGYGFLGGHVRDAAFSVGDCCGWTCACVLEFGLVAVGLVCCVGVFVSSGVFYVLLCCLTNLAIYC